MNLKRITNIYKIIYERLPSTYPHPKLIFYEDCECMVKALGFKKSRDEDIFAIFDPNTGLINIPIDVFKILSDSNIAKIFLHEIYHAYVDHNNITTKIDEEILADKFATRWIKKINIKANGNFMGWTSEEVEYLKLNYSWKPKTEIVNIIGRSWEAIRIKASNIGIKRINQSKYWCDHYFFSPPFNKTKMWVAGFIAAHGCIRSDSFNIKIDIAYKDIDTLRKIKKAINSTGNIIKYKRDKNEYSILSFSSKQMVQDLNRYFNIKSKKSLTFSPHKNIAQSELFNHFLRGYSDGNGSFYIYSKNKLHHLRYKLLGSKDFLTQTLTWFNKKGIKPVKIGKLKNIYYISFSGNIKVKQIADALYENSNEETCMIRKKEVQDSILIKQTMQKKYTSIIKINPLTGEKEIFRCTKDAVKLGYTYSGIYDACNGKSKTHRGFRWEYL